MTRPMSEAARVARTKSPVAAHAIARSTRPPSRGNAGSRFTTARDRLATPTQKATVPIAITRSLVPGAPSNDAIASHGARQIAPSTRFTTGPASPMTNSARAPGASCSTRAEAPKTKSRI